MFEQHKKESPIISLLGMGGGVGSYIFTGPDGYQISRSLRFNSTDSAYLSRTPSSAGNRKTWTWSGWVKLSAASQGWFLQARDSIGTTTQLKIDIRNDNLRVNFRSGGSTAADFQGVSLLRDFSAWYHFVVACDTTQATASDRLKLYINGLEESASSVTYPSQNFESVLNTTISHQIGQNLPNSGSPDYSDYYLAETYLIDGQALDPTSFGEFDDNNVWQPKAYAGTYGTNGFHLDFSDNSSNAALGDDSSGNNNDWTVNNLVADDSPSNDVWTNGSKTITVGGTRADYGNNTYTTGPEFWEVTINTMSAVSSVGIVFDANKGVESNANRGYFMYSDGRKLGDGSVSSYGSSWTAGDTIGVELTSSNDVVFYKNGVSQGTAFTSVSGTFRIQASYHAGGATLNVTLASNQGSDSLVDSPTNGTQTDTGAGGEVVGNYAVINALNAGSNSSLTDGNLKWTRTSNGYSMGLATIGVSSGKWYYEHTFTGSQNNAIAVGIVPVDDTSSYPGQSSNSVGYNFNGTKVIGTTQTSYGATYDDGDVVGVAFDADNGTVVFYKNGVSQGTATSSLSNGPYTAAVSAWGSGTGSIMNFGQRTFAYTAPSGFKALCTANLPDPTIADGSTAMDVKLYTGNGSTQTISGLDFSPDLVWIKRRDSAGNHALFDQVRGAGKFLISSSTSAEGTDANSLTGFTSDGFSVGQSTTAPTVNGTSQTYVGWAWDGGTSNATNTDGSITSTVRANASAGFSIVTYTGNKTDNTTVGHGLGAAPEFIFAKNRDVSNDDWMIYHKSFNASTDIALEFNTSTGTSGDKWRRSLFSSTVFGLATGDQNNGNGERIVAYCFAPVDGYSSAFTYTGNGSSDGPMVYLGHRPRFLLIKASSFSENWTIIDTARDTYNASGLVLQPNDSNAEVDWKSSFPLDLLSNGFKLRNTGDRTNRSGATYIGFAFAENPFKYARAR